MHTDTIKSRIARHELALLLLLGGIITNLVDAWITLAVTQPAVVEGNPIVLALGWEPWLVVKAFALVAFVAAWWIGREHRLSTLLAAGPLPFGLIGALGNASASGWFATDHGSIAVLASLVAVSLPLFVARRSVRSVLPVSRLPSLNRSSIRVVGIVAIVLMLALSPVLPWLGGIGIINPDYSPVQIVSADVENSTFNSSFDVSELTPKDVSFNKDGSKMYVTGASGDDVYEYSLSTPFDVSTASQTVSFDVSGQDGNPTSVTFNKDGSKMFVLGGTNDNVYEYSLSTPFDVSTASYSTSFSIGAQDGTPQGLAFNDDGSKMYVTGKGNANVDEYSLSTPFDMSTASHSRFFDVSGQDIYPTGVTFNGDGSLMFISGDDTNSIYEYSLSTQFDVSTASYNNSFSVLSQDDMPEDVAFNDDGSKMYVMGRSNTNVLEYDTSISGYTSTVSGTVTNSSGSTISGATVEIEDSSGTAIESHTTDTNGYWETQLEDGDYTVVTSATGYNTNTKAFSVAGSAVTVDQTLSKTKYSVEGHVLNSEANPVGDATVEISDDTGVVTTTQANGAGKYSVSLENGTYTAEASKTNYFNGSRTLEVAGPLTAQNITLGQQTLSGTVEKQDGQPCVNCTVEVWGVDHSNVTPDGFQSIEDRARELIADSKNLTPESFDPNLDLAGRDGEFDQANGKFVAVHTDSDWELRGYQLSEVAHLGADPQLGQPLVRAPANERLMLSVWTTEKDPLLEDTVDGDLPGVTVPESQTIVVEQVGPSNSTINEPITLDTTETVTYASRFGKTHYTAATELPTGFYRVYPEDNPSAAYVIAVGDTSSMVSSIQADLKSDANQLSQKAEEIRSQMTDGKVVRHRVTTNAKGEWTVHMKPDVKTAGVQAWKTPAGMSKEPQDATLEDIKNYWEDTDYNGSVVLPAEVETTAVPNSDVTVDVREFRAPQFTSLDSVAEFTEWFYDFLKTHSYSETISAAQQRLEDMDSEQAQQMADVLMQLAAENEELRDKAEENLNQGGGTENIIVEVNESSNEDLRERIDALSQALAELRSTIDSEQTHREIWNDRATLAWSFDSNLDPQNVAVLVHYANGTTKTLTTESEYVRVESNIGDDEVVIEDYPITAEDPSSVQFEVQVATAEGVGRAGDTIDNPADDVRPPSLGAVDFSTLQPGPDESVGVKLHGGKSTTITAIQEMTVYGPDGSELNTTVDGDEGSFVTNGAGIHFVKAKFETQDGRTGTFTYRIKASDQPRDMPAGVRLADTPYGTAAVVGDGLSGGDVKVEEGGSQMTVLAQIGEKADVPPRLHIYTEGKSLPPQSELTIRVVRGEDQEAVSKRVAVTVHLSSFDTSGATLYSNGEPLAREGSNARGSVEATNGGTTISTFTDASGVVMVETNAQPGWYDRASYYVATVTAGIDVPLLALMPNTGWVPYEAVEDLSEPLIWMATEISEPSLPTAPAMAPGSIAAV